MTAARVLMIGPAEYMPGGMSAVVASYREAGLFNAVRLRYFSSYEGAAAVTQMRVFGKVWLRLLANLLFGRVDLLHVHSASRGSFWRKSLLCRLAHLFGKPYLFHLHSGEFPAFYSKECGPLGRWWVRRTMLDAAAVLVLTASWRDQLAALIPGIKMFVAPNPVRVPAAMQAPRQQVRTLLFLGRLREKKGAFDLLRAMPAVLSAWPDLRLILAGDGDLDRAHALAAELGIGDAVDMPGWIDGDAKTRALAQADLFILPSYFEGLPIGVLEAMAAGVPVIASRVGGIPDLIADGLSGLLFDAADVSTLAALIIRAVGDAPLRIGLAQAAFEAVQVHDARRVVEEMAAFYARLTRASQEADS